MSKGLFFLLAGMYPKLNYKLVFYSNSFFLWSDTLQFIFSLKYLALILSLSFSAMMLSDLAKLPVLYLIPSIVYLVWLNYTVMYVTCRFRSIAAYLVPPVFFISALTSYFHGVYGVTVDKELIFLLLETNCGEAGEFMTPEVMIFGITALLFSVAIFFLLRRSTGSINKKTVAILLVILLPTTVLLSAYKKTQPVRKVRPAVAIKYAFPYSVITGFADFTCQFIKNITKGKLLSAAALPSSFTKSATPLKLIIIIGESARADRFQLNGYMRDTTPKLSIEKNLINFGAITSFAAYTRLSVPAMITPATSKHPETTMSSYCGLFKKHGFSTTWISANDRFSSNDTPTTQAIGNVDQKIFRNTLGDIKYSEFQDAMLLAPLKKTLTNGADDDQAITIHTRGSHANYAARYSKEFKRFTPDIYTEDMEKEIIDNAYDNSILATDSFIASIIDLVRDENAVVVYSSDHGESLGEEGRFGHGNANAAEQRNVPFFIWVSDTYSKTHPRAVAALKNKVCSPLSHDVFFPWILNLGGICIQDTTQTALLTSCPSHQACNEN